MNSFYGSLKNNSRASFIFDKVYPTRTLMEASAISDGVFVNRYVLIAYDYEEVSLGNGGHEVKINPRYGNFLIEHQNITNAENSQFIANRNTDIENYGAQFDKTVWMKIYSNNVEKYIQVGALNATAPAFELTVDAPSEEQPHFDYYHSGDLTYSYHMPRNWNIDLNRFNNDIEKDDSLFEKVETLPAADSDEWKNNKYYFKNPINEYYYLELNGQREGIEYYQHSEKYNYQHNDLLNDDDIATQLSEYPYVNSRGFSLTTRYYDYENIDDISFTEVPSGKKYPDHVFLPILLTIDTYTKNTYYALEDGEFIFQDSDQEFDSNKNYYIKTQGEFINISFGDEIPYAANKFFYLNDKNEYIVDSSPSAIEGRTYYTFKISHATSVQDDTKRLDIELPSIGNAISDVYDSIYGRPLHPNYPNGIKYIYQLSKQNSSYPYQDYYDAEHNYQCSINGKYYYLKPSEWEENGVTPAPLYTFYDENEHPIPVYNLANADRPYTQQQLYNFLNIEPYNNVTPMDPVSMAWGVEELKRYISELRYLSHGETDGDFDPVVYNGNGLQSDWAVDDPTAFGYIYNRPLVISHYKQVVSNEAIDPKDILYVRDVDDDKHVPYFFEGNIEGVSQAPQFNYRVENYTLLTENDMSDEGWYQPNTYYYKNIHGNYVLDSSDTATSDRKYYRKELGNTIGHIPITLKDKNQPATFRTYDNIAWPFVYQVADPTTRYKFDEVLRDYSNVNLNVGTNNARDYSVQSNLMIITKGYTKVTFDENNNYSPNSYYYKSKNGYIIDNSSEAVEGRQYYTEQSLGETNNSTIKVYTNNKVKNDLFKYSYVPISSTLYEKGKYYTYNNTTHVYTLDNKNDNPIPSIQYYKQIVTGELNPSKINDAYLGLGGKLIYEIWIKNIDEDLSTETLFDFIDRLNEPGFYDEHIEKIVYATNRLIDTTVPPNVMDLTAIRDGKFHLYTNIQSAPSGIAIEKIWQNIPVDDIIVAEMYYDIEDISDVLGDGIVYNTESINVLESPFLALNTSVDDLQGRTITLEKKVGIGKTISTTSLTSEIQNIKDYVGIDNTAEKTLTKRTDDLEALVGTTSITETLATRISSLEGYSMSHTSAISGIQSSINSIESNIGDINTNDTIKYDINQNSIKIAALEDFVGNIDNSVTSTLSYRLDNAEINDRTMNTRINSLEDFVGNTNSTTYSLAYISDNTKNRVIDLETFVGDANSSTTDTLAGRLTDVEIQTSTNTNNITLLQNYTGINDSEQSTTATLNARITSIEEEISQEP